MSEIESIQKSIAISRSELKNIRQEVMKLKIKEKKAIEEIKLLLSNLHCKKEKDLNVKDKSKNSFDMVPIGFISSCFKSKNGIPRQPSLCQASKATLQISKTFFTNPEHSLIGLNEFSYIWILFVFDKNKENSVKAKVHPPRLNGASVGVFSTRSPHRPCPIGLSLTKIEKITGNVIFLSGVDILDGTPVLDIKPYIPSYDDPKSFRSIEGGDTSENSVSLKDINESLPSSPEEILAISTPKDLKSKDKTLDMCSEENNSENVDDELQTHIPTFSIGEMLKMPTNHLQILFTERATKDIERFHSVNPSRACEYCLKFLNGFSEAKQAIVDILKNDPRSVYRKSKCPDKLYFFEIDSLHVTCWFDNIVAEVLRVKPINKYNTA